MEKRRKRVSVSREGMFRLVFGNDMYSARISLRESAWKVYRSCFQPTQTATISKLAGFHRRLKAFGVMVSIIFYLCYLFELKKQ